MNIMPLTKETKIDSIIWFEKNNKKYIGKLLLLEDNEAIVHCQDNIVRTVEVK